MPLVPPLQTPCSRPPHACRTHISHTAPARTRSIPHCLLSHHHHNHNNNHNHNSRRTQLHGYHHCCTMMMMMMMVRMIGGPHAAHGRRSWHPRPCNQEPYHHTRSHSRCSRIRLCSHLHLCLSLSPCRGSNSLQPRPPPNSSCSYSNSSNHSSNNLQPRRPPNSTSSSSSRAGQLLEAKEDCALLASAPPQPCLRRSMWRVSWPGCERTWQ